VGQPASIDTAVGNVSLVSFGSERDATGALTSLVEGGVARAVGHDGLGRLTAVGDQAFASDEAGSLTELRGATLAYDPGGRLASMTGADGSAAYAFDAAGRRTGATTGASTTRYAYDGAGRLVGVRDPSTGSDATWAYDGDGFRVGLVDPGVGIDATFVWGHGSGDSELLDDGSVRYVYGPAGTPIEQVARDGTATWFHPDLTGSVRALTDADGQAVASFDWDAYGLPAGSTGTATTRLGFQGAWTDPGTGLRYLRARAYDPVTAQFLTIDPLVTSTHHAYAFAAGDPLAFGDPTGTDPRPAPPRLDTKGKAKDYALAGHGSWDPANGYLIVPPGTTIIFYGPAGSPISDELGQQIEDGQVTQRYHQVYQPGDRVPDYTLGAPDGLSIRAGSARVTGDMRLSQMLKPDQGSLRWAACRSPTDRTITMRDANGGEYLVVPGHVDAPIWHIKGIHYETPSAAGPSWTSGACCATRLVRLGLRAVLEGGVKGSRVHGLGPARRAGARPGIIEARRPAQDSEDSTAHAHGDHAPARRERRRGDHRQVAEAGR